ncbi:hypothetical protein QEN19_000305 [Hanseniaspora menglaensis]
MQLKFDDEFSERFFLPDENECFMSKSFTCISEKTMSSDENYHTLFNISEYTECALTKKNKTSHIKNLKSSPICPPEIASNLEERKTIQTSTSQKKLLQRSKAKFNMNFSKLSEIHNLTKTDRKLISDNARPPFTLFQYQNRIYEIKSKTEIFLP